MRQFASLVFLSSIAALCLGCGNSEADKVVREKKKVRVDWSEKAQQSDEWWAEESTRKRESQAEYVAEREEDRADADQDRPLSERRRRRHAAKFAADEEQVDRDERPARDEEKPRRRLTDEIEEETE